MILSLERKTPEKALKAVREVLEPEPVCSEREIRLALWMRQRYFCTFYDAIRTILPAGRLVPLPPVLEARGLRGRGCAFGEGKAALRAFEPGRAGAGDAGAGRSDAAALLRQMEKKGLVTSRTEGSRRVATAW